MYIAEEMWFSQPSSNAWGWGGLRELVAAPEGTGVVEEGFPEGAFEGVGGGAVAVEVAEPFAVGGVGEVVEGPVAELVVPVEVFFVAGLVVGHEGGDEGFVVRPPEFHVVPVFLDGFLIEVAEVVEAAVFGVPAAVPHPVEHVAADLAEGGVVAVGGFLKDEPCGFDGVAGVELAAVEVVDDGAIWGDGFHDCLEVGFDEEADDVVEAAVDPCG